ncbi:MAG: RnfABCDGE type electron transport complex subunit A [Clostridia bacterium]|nr:RnfABCDGE type electron transport complex subunit A [Clostridia bacterium]MBQ2388256.1 RnfABCDGE type electron transport complex subunit A [Clostridia bacterium]MBQ2420503.1 RnfABCDGE type electron transport complex subunit A [Clostridia bacterium]MBQ5902544.1 RnfABCDGE type electron transport complex subunit A [Clostridia bacterium]
MMKEMLIIFFTAILTNNFVLAKFLGICPFLGVSKKPSTAFSMSVAVTLVMVIATAATWPVHNYILVKYGLEYLQTIVFILIIAALVQLIETAIKKFSPPLYQALGIYLPLITTNCAVLGVTVLNISESYTLAESLVNAFGAGIGFLVAMMIFSGVRGRMESCDIPKALQGLPITLIAASITALTFLGFGGIVENLFA